MTNLHKRLANTDGDSAGQPQSQDDKKKQKYLYFSWNRHVNVYVYTFEHRLAQLTTFTNSRSMIYFNLH